MCVQRTDEGVRSDCFQSIRRKRKVRRNSITRGRLPKPRQVHHPLQWPASFVRPHPPWDLAPSEVRRLRRQRPRHLFRTGSSPGSVDGLCGYSVVRISDSGPTFRPGLECRPEFDNGPERRDLRQREVSRRPPPPPASRRPSLIKSEVQPDSLYVRQRGQHRSMRRTTFHRNFPEVDGV